MKKILRFQNAVRGKIESFSQLDSRIKNSDISLSENETALTAVLSFDGFSVKIVYSDYDVYRGYNFLEDNKLNGKCLNTSFVFPMLSFSLLMAGMNTMNFTRGRNISLFSTRIMMIS